MSNLKATTYPNGNFKSQSMCNKDKTDDFRVQWYESGHMKSAGEYKHRKRDGLHTSWHENGQKSAEINYNQGVKDGQITLWYKDGSKRLETSYSNGRISGLYVSWHESGQIQKAVLFKNQKKVSKAYEILSDLGIEEAALRMPSDLSGGMRKRVAIARSLIISPNILLYDEPTAELDPINTKIISQIINNLKNNSSITQIVVTHDIDFAYSIADKISILENGNIAVTGDSADVKKSNNAILAPI